VNVKRTQAHTKTTNLSTFTSALFTGGPIIDAFRRSDIIILTAGVFIRLETVGVLVEMCKALRLDVSVTDVDKKRHLRDVNKIDNARRILMQP
jgi:hypothetical protein